MDRGFNQVWGLGRTLRGLKSGFGLGAGLDPVLMESPRSVMTSDVVISAAYFGFDLAISDDVTGRRTKYARYMQDPIQGTSQGTSLALA